MDGSMESCIRRLGHPHIADTPTPATNHTTQALTGLPSELMRATSYMQHLVKILFMYVSLSILYIRVNHQSTPT